MGSLYCSQYELVFVFKNEDTPIQTTLNWGGAWPLPYGRVGLSGYFVKSNVNKANIGLHRLVFGHYIGRQPVWWADFERELLQFPNGRHDDQCDALSQLLTYEQQDRTSLAWLNNV